MSTIGDLTRRRDLEKELELLTYLLEEEGFDPAPVVREIGPRPPEAGWPLSFAQQRLWFLERWSPDTAVYNVADALRLRGTLDPRALTASLTEVIRRHEALRAVFEEADGTPVQRLLPATFDLPWIDLRALPAERREAEESRLTLTEARRPFSLARGPLIHVKLLRLADDEHLLLFVLHHIVADGWSINLLISEALSLYRGFTTGGWPTLPELPIQYTDFAWWQRQWLQGEVLENLLAWWRERLAGAPELLDLPTDRPRPPLRSERGASVALSHRLAIEPLAALARERGATLFMLLLAAFQTLLARWSGQNDIVVGTPIANRNRPEIEGLIGLFVNTLALRADLAGDPSFIELLDRMRDVVIGAYDHQDLPFEKLLDELKPERDPSRTPVIQVLLVLQNFPRDPITLPNLIAEPVQLGTATAKLDLLLEFTEMTDGLHVRLEHSTDLFDTPSMLRLLDHLERLLAAVVAEPSVSLSELPLLGPAERWQLLAEWNDTATSWRAEEGSLHSLFEAQAARTPEAPALVFTEECLSYEELDRRTNALAWRLRAAGVGECAVVGVLLDRSVEMIVALYGVLKVGAAYLPLEPTYPRERLALLLEDARPALVLSRADLGELLPAGTRVELLAAGAPEGVSQAPETAAAGESLAYVIYTSGSTGRPKGVMVPHAGIRNRLLWMQAAYGLDARDRVLQKTPFSFDVSVWEFFWPLLTGACLVVARPEGHRDSAYLAELIGRERITTVHFVPSMLRAFLEEPDLSGCSWLRRVICSGEALSPDLVERFRQRLAGVELHNLYGPTEASVDVTAWACPREGAIRVVPIGRPVWNTSVHVLDGSLRLVPQRVAGELYLGGVQLARGYLARPELTAERFVPDPYATEPGARLYRSGDRVRLLPTGEVEYLGRVDRQVKIRGFRIEPGEIEMALIEHPGLAEAAVVDRLDLDGTRRLVAYLVAAEEEDPGLNEVREWLAARLPAHMVPAAFTFLPALPLTSSGKLDRGALPAANANRSMAGTAYEAPRNEAEELMAGVWEKVLGVSRVGIHDNFFALGGDSMHSVQVLSLAREAGFDLTLNQLFQHQTVTELMREIFRDSAGRTGEALTRPFELVSEKDRERFPANVEDAYPLTAVQSGMLYHMRYEPDAIVYHNVYSILLKSRFKAESLRRAVQLTIDRHAILRTSFDLVSFDEPLQVVHREVSMPLEVDDLRGLTQEQVAAEIDRFVEEEARLPFDLSRPPLVRLHVHLVADDVFYFSFTECHPIFDGWSLHTFLREIFDRYQTALEGLPTAPTTPPRTTVRDFVAIERAAIASPDCRNFWAEKLRGCEALTIPRWPGTPTTDGRSRTIDLRLTFDDAVFSGLQRTARDLAVSLKSLLLAAHMKVLSMITGRQDVISGLVSGGRPEGPDAESVLGLFFNVVPFRLALGEGSWTDLVREVFRTEQEIAPYRRYPLARIQNRQERGELFDVLFNYLHFHMLSDALRSGALEPLGDSRRWEETTFPFSVTFVRSPGIDLLTLALRYEGREFFGAQVERIRGLYERAVVTLAHEPGSPHGLHVLLSEPERHQVLTEWNDLRSLPWSGRTVLDFFLDWAERTPHAPALVSEGRRWTYAELAGAVYQLARHLRREGVGPEVFVGLLLQRSAEAIVALLGVLAAGGAYLPLEPDFPRERLEAMLTDAGAPLVLTLSGLEERIAGLPVRTIRLNADRELLEREDPRPFAPGITPDNAAYALFTSGSTGRPKGVVVAHHHLASYVEAVSRQMALPSGSRYALTSTLSADLGNTTLFPALCGGGCLYVAPDHVVSDPGTLEEVLRREPVDVVKIVPSHLAALLAGSRSDLLPRRLAVLGGEACPWDLVRVIRRLRPECDVMNHYGPTETTVGATAYRIPGGEEISPRGMTVPLGRPLGNSRIYLVGPAGESVGVGVSGEIWIGGGGVARAYLGRPDLTAERFIPDPFAGEPGARVYRTGDQARFLPDGRIEFLGRTDHQIKIRGIRIESKEVEAALLRQPGVREAVVMARRDTAGEMRLVAYVVSDREADPIELRSACRRWLPDVMLPSAILRIPEVPRTANGKVDIRALPEPTLLAAEWKAPYVGPDNDLERTIAKVWEEVLGLDQVGMNDNFFDLGGHSLFLLRVHGKLEAALGRRTPMMTLFEYPTIRALAEHLAGRAPEAAAPEEAAGRADARRGALQARGAARRRALEGLDGEPTP
jgi:amino acid adenylation domain-containing protein